MERRALLATLGSAATAGVAGCITIGGAPPTPDGMEVRSPAFDDGGTIPREHTCDGAGRSPPFTFSDLPEPTEAVALVCRYPNSFAQNFTHWLLWNVPPDRGEIPGGLPDTEVLPGLGGARQGLNGIGEVGYLPVCPPPALDEEEYRFRLYALRQPLDLPGGANKERFEEAIEGAVLSSIRYVGFYDRPDDVTGTARGR
ncbi:MAG: YbhB/YbcL family Raf kinase inhibitor-like protein [Haloglomus sp.]